MTLEEFIARAQALKPSLKNKEIVIVAPNGIEFEPKIKQQFDNPTDLFDPDVEPLKLVITWD